MSVTTTCIKQFSASYQRMRYLIAGMKEPYSKENLASINIWIDDQKDRLEKIYSSICFDKIEACFSETGTQQIESFLT